MAYKRITHFVSILISLVIALTIGLEPLHVSAETVKAATAPAAQAESLFPYVELLASTAEKAVLLFSPGQPELENPGLNGSSCQTISIPGLTAYTAAQMPDMPVQGIMLAIPAGAQPTLKITAQTSHLLPQTTALCPATQIKQPESAERQNANEAALFVSEPYEIVNRFLPAQTAEIIETGFIRSQRYVQIRVFPLQYNSANGTLRYYESVQLELSFNTAPGTSGSYVAEPYFEDILKNTLINYEAGLSWRQPRAVQNEEEVTSEDLGRYKILVNRDGIYELTYAELIAAGIPAVDLDMLDPRTFQLFNQDQEVSIEVGGENDGSFDVGDSLLFYGTSPSTEYTNTNVYWLVWGKEPGLRMSTVNGSLPDNPTFASKFMAKQSFEKNIRYEVNFHTDDDDLWWWEMVYANQAPGHKDFSFHASQISEDADTFVFRGFFSVPILYRSHQVNLYLNGTLFKTESFSNLRTYSFENVLPISYLLEGNNSLRVELEVMSGDVDAVYFHWMELEYFRSFIAELNSLTFNISDDSGAVFQIDNFSTDDIEAFIISDPTNPVRVSSITVEASSLGFTASFAPSAVVGDLLLCQTTTQRLAPPTIFPDSPSNLKNPDSGADYLIISHQQFLNEVQVLADFRETKGLKVEVVDLQNVYDEFSSGLSTPEAIKDFISYAYQSWHIRPSYVLLVGDGHYDFKNFLGDGDVNFIPPYLDEVDPWVVETPTDNRYVCVSGSDILPDMFIGRFPVGTDAEAELMVNRAIAYETNAPIGSWTNQLLFVADNADSAGNFPESSDQAVALIPAPYAVSKVYVGVDTDPKIKTIAAINQGKLLVHYFGHGSTQLWAYSPSVLQNGDLANLTNSAMLPFFMPMTCTEGYYIQPRSRNFPSLGESLVRHPGGGALASWSPAAEGLHSGHVILSNALLNDLFNGYHNQLGYLTTQAKYTLVATTSLYRDLIETYHLFGDPALRLNITYAQPEAPSELSAEGISNTEITLSWESFSTTANELRLERSPNGTDSWEEIAVLPTDAISYLDSGLPKSSTFSYRLRAFRAGDLGMSDYTNIAMAMTLSNSQVFLPLIQR